MKAKAILDEPPSTGQTASQPLVTVALIHPPSTAWTAWTQQEGWRTLAGDEAERGHQARRALADLALYPAGPLELDSAFGVLEQNCRTALGQIVNELGRTDLTALYGLARLLALAPRDDEIFEYIRALDAKALAPRDDEMFANET